MSGKKNERNAGLPNARERAKRKKMVPEIRALIALKVKNKHIIQHVMETLRRDWSYHQSQRFVLKVRKGLI